MDEIQNMKFNSNLTKKLKQQPKQQIASVFPKPSKDVTY